MMKEITVSAKTVDDAITEASIQLGVTSDRMEYDVIEKGSAGFFGIGSKQAVIKARLKEEKAEESVEDIVKKEFSADKKESKKNFKKEGKDTKKEYKKEIKEQKAAGKEVQETSDAAEAKSEGKAEHRSSRKDAETVVIKESTKKACEEFLTEVLKAMGMEAVEITSVVDEDGAISIEMSGDNMGILIGKRGQTLDSLQYLTNRVANKSQEGYVRVKLDTEDYRRRRRQTLENLAKNIAYKVKRTRKPVSLEPMNPYERRIIHSVLQGDDRISTHSEGEEPYRRVVVTPNRR